MDRTEKQKKSSQENRQNGGVKTTEGKEISKMNALTHGILASCITKYDSIDAESLYMEFVDEFGADTLSRKILIQQLALTVLRLARCARAETELLREAMNPPVVEVKDCSAFGDFDFSTTVTTVISKGEPATLSESDLAKFTLIHERYEPRLVSRMLRLIKLLKSFE